MSLPTDRIRNKATLLHDLATAVAEGEPLPFDQAADVCVLQVDGGLAAADQTWTQALASSDGETITIGLQTYIAKTALSVPAVPNEYLREAVLSDEVDNLIAAINRDESVEGTKFATGTPENIDVTAAAGVGDTMDVTARRKGTASNTIATTDTQVGAGNAWGAATLTGGTDFVGDVDFLASLDDDHFFPIVGVPLAGGAGVTQATAEGAWRIDMAGVAIFKAPISAYTSGEITVRILHRRKSQG
jgi:hypothetical protein